MKIFPNKTCLRATEVIMQIKIDERKDHDMRKVFNLTLKIGMYKKIGTL